MTSGSEAEISRGRQEVEEGSLETCSVRLQRQRKLIRADKGEIRKRRKLCVRSCVCGHLHKRENKQVGGEGGQTEKREMKM